MFGTQIAALRQRSVKLRGSLLRRGNLCVTSPLGQMRHFSTNEEPPREQDKNSVAKQEAAAEAASQPAPKLKATAKAGYRMPRLRDGEQMVAFRPSGHTKLT